MGNKSLWAALLSAAFIIAPSGAGADPLKERLEAIQRPDLAEIVLPRDRLRPSYNSGATHWISPMLENAPGTIGGEHYTIDGKRLYRTFEISVINPSAERAANVYVNCYNAGGAMLSRYTTTFAVPPSGASNWNASSVTPPATTDGASEDVDNIWCVTGADGPVVAFGWTVRRFGGDVSRYHFSLERASAAE